MITAVVGTSATAYGAGASTNIGSGNAAAVSRGAGGGGCAVAPGVPGGKGGSGFVCVRYPIYFA